MVVVAVIVEVPAVAVVVVAVVAVVTAGEGSQPQNSTRMKRASKFPIRLGQTWLLVKNVASTGPEIQQVLRSRPIVPPRMFDALPVALVFDFPDRLLTLLRRTRVLGGRTYR